MRKLLLVLSFQIALGVSAQTTSSNDVDVSKYPSGDEEIDQVRKEVLIRPTGPSDYVHRSAILRLWAAALGQQGAKVEERYQPVYINTRHINSLENEEKRNEAISRYGPLIDEAYRVLHSVQKDLVETPSDRLEALMPDPSKVELPDNTDRPWTQYQGNLAHTGFNGSDGPVYGRVAWKFPVGLAWESRPVVEDDEVFLASPGTRNILFTIDLHTGEVINTVRQQPIMGSVYNIPAMASTPILLKDQILMREIGSRGNTGPAKEVVHISRETGQVAKETYAGHIDYRVGYAPLAANDKYMVFPFSIQDIETTPPETQAFNHIICKDATTGEQIRDVHVGQTFAEPLLDGEMVYIGTRNGYVYGFDASVSDPPNRRVVMARDQEVTWAFKAAGAVNRRVTVDSAKVYFGANDGAVYCLDKKSGDLIWKYSVETPVEASFRHFSTPFAVGGYVFIGSADKHLYCLNATDGTLVFKYESSDWIRARPVATSSNVYFASLNSDLYNIDYSDGTPELLWKKRIGDHWVIADLALSGDKLVLNDSDLYSYCVDTKDGDVRWRFSVLKSFRQADGYRVFTDQLAGGGYYQSKSIAVDGKIFIGTPSRFVYALDAENGEEIWKYELGAAISGAPVYDNGKIYIGQQGGEDDFYCLDAETGKLVWRQNVGWVWGSATVSDGLVFIPGIDGYVNCLDGETGHIIWRFRTDKSVCSEPMVNGDYVYFGSWDHFLYKFEKRTGKLVWKYANGGTDSGVTIAFDDKLVLPGAGMTCVNAETKELLWKPELSGSTNGTPAYHDGQVFVSLWNAELIALDANEGTINWSLKGAAGITAAVVGNNGYIYSGARGNPYFSAYSEKGNGNGSTDCLFRVRMANGVTESTPALYRGRAYVLSGGGYFYAIE